MFLLVLILSIMQQYLHYYLKTPYLSLSSNDFSKTKIPFKYTLLNPSYSLISSFCLSTWDYFRFLFYWLLWLYYFIRSSCPQHICNIFKTSFFSKLKWRNIFLIGRIYICPVVNKHLNYFLVIFTTIS